MDERCTSYEEDEEEDEEMDQEQGGTAEQEKEQDGGERRDEGCSELIRQIQEVRNQIKGNMTEGENKGKEQEQEQEQNQEQEVREAGSGEEDAKWLDALRDLYEGTGIEIEDDAVTVNNFAKEAGFDTESSQQNLSMAALLIRENQLLKEKLEKEREKETRRGRKKASTEKKSRSKSRRDQSVENRSKRPPSRQVQKPSSSSSEED